MTDSALNIIATPNVCERVYACVSARSGGVSRSNVSYFTGLAVTLVDSALEQMESRGAVRRDGAIWRATKAEQ